ncbi:MAG: sigma 54-interacting transcriptional regulator [bacterium]
MNIRLLFLGLQCSSCCHMAGAFARRRAMAGLSVTVATVEDGRKDPLADEVMAEAGLPLGDEPGVLLKDVLRNEYDIVVVVCPQAAAQLPLLPGRPTLLHWKLPDPTRFSQEIGARREAFRNLRDTIRRLTGDFFEQGSLEAIADSRAYSAMIIDSISDGLLAHDLQRRIVLFNRAAEEITGRRRQDVLGHDCHQVFGCGFCGGKCVLANIPAAAEPGFDERRERIELTTTGGEQRTLEARIRPLREADGRWAGLVAVFHDITREFALARRMGELQSFAGIVGRESKMQEVFDLIRDVADSTVPILIRGESGTGKELVAAAIHNEGPRAGKPFIAVNCGALPEGLLESELFGHVRGAFTGAIRDKKGRFELADGGTIFLDEIGDISPAMQVRLLRVLQEGVMQRVGSEASIQVDVRVISATHRDLQKEIADGRFREDLFYRLNVVPIWIPPLRERLADIPLLVDHLLARFLSEMGRATTVRLSPEAMDVLLTCDWPGNVRELQNWLQYALVKCHGQEIRPEHLPPSRVVARTAAAAAPASPARDPLTVERVRDVLVRCRGNRRDAARALGVARATLYRFFDAHPEVAAEQHSTRHHA